MGTGEVSFGAREELHSEAFVESDAWGWSDLSPHPVRRWLARVFDCYVTTGLVLAAVAGGGALVAGANALQAIGLAGLLYFIPPLRGYISAVLNAALVSGTSTTPGKWLCGVRIVDYAGGRPSFRTALLREQAVLGLGCGLYLPLLNLVAMGWWFVRLPKVGTASWDDRCGLIVRHRADGPWQVLGVGVAALGTLAGVAAIVTVSLVLDGVRDATAR